MARTPRPERPSLREAQRALTRDRLREGARALFAEKPYSEATIDEIAARSGVARATFYLHYDGKDALLRDLLSDVMLSHRGLYFRLADLGSQPEGAQLQGWVRRYMKAFREHRQTLSLFNVVTGSDPSFLSHITRERDALFDDAGRRHPAFAFAADPEGRSRRMKAHLLVFQIEQFCSHAAFVDWPAEIEDIGVTLLADDLGRFLRRQDAREQD